MTSIPKYHDEAAFPQPHQKRVGLNEERDVLLPAQWGLTKREYIATQALIGLCAAEDQTDPWTAETIAAMAVSRADALLAELAK